MTVFGNTIKTVPHISDPKRHGVSVNIKSTWMVDSFVQPLAVLKYKRKTVVFKFVFSFFLVMVMSVLVSEFSSIQLAFDTCQVPPIFYQIRFNRSVPVM